VWCEQGIPGEVRPLARGDSLSVRIVLRANEPQPGHISSQNIPDSEGTVLAPIAWSRYAPFLDEKTGQMDWMEESSY
jgi:hypothetical protein